MSENIQVPKGWEIKKLGEVCDSIVRGPFGSALKKEYFIDYEKSAYKVYEQKNAIQENHKLGNYFISEEKFRTLKRFECKPNDIIMSCSGTIGKLYTIPFNAHKGIINQALLKITLNNKIIDYIFKILFSFEINKLTLAGSGIQNISSIKYLKNIAIPVPPLEEQKKIAEILSLWDKAIEQTKELIAYKEKQKKGLMQALLTGKKRLQGFTDEWDTVKLGEVCEYQNGDSNEKNIINNGNYSLITLNSIDINGRLKKEHKRINQGKPILYKNDIVMILSDIAHGFLLGLSAVIDENDKYILNQRVGLLRPQKQINSLFLSYLINLNQSYFKKHGQGSSQLNLSKGDIINFQLYIPLNIEEQNFIVKTISKADEEIELLNKQLDLYMEQKKGLMQNLLTGKIRVKV